jgi:hypothetical protein
VHRPELVVELRQHNPAWRVCHAEEVANMRHRLTGKRELPPDDDDEQEPDQQE